MARRETVTSIVVPASFSFCQNGQKTTKVRIVFDCLARHSGVSLINVIHARPKMQSELFDNLIHVRRNPVGIVCDIEEMYLTANQNRGEGPTLLQISLAQL